MTIDCPILSNRGIYQIKNISNGRVYIGQSCQLSSRKKQHFILLKKGANHNGHLQNTFNKYGEESFVFSILLYCEQFELTRYENCLINQNKILELSYNIRESCDTNAGIKYSPERIAGISGKNHHFFGKHHSKETLRKMSAAHSGENNHYYGKKHSEETRKKISENHVHLKGINNPLYGKPLSEETKRKISIANRGQIITEETRKKLSKATKEYWNRKRELNDNLSYLPGKW